jgi:HEAT repeat protein
MKTTLLPALFLLSACTTVPDEPTKSTELVPVAPSASPADPGHEGKVAQALMDLDKRVDRFAMLSAQPGAEAREERDLLGRSLMSQVVQFKADLLRIAKDPSNPVRRRIAVKALAFSQGTDATEPLVAALDAKGDAVLLVNAAYAIARLHDPATPTSKLLALLKDGDSDVRSNALLALWHVFDARREIGASVVDPLEQRDALTLVEPSLYDPANPLLRAHAAAALGALGDARAVDPLVNTLRDTHPLVRTQTAIALGKIGDAKAIPSLVQVIDSSPDGTPKTAVLLSIGALAEKQGRRVPETLGTSQRAWERWVKEEFAK